MYVLLCLLHWSISQFTPCPINIHPQNKYERLYAVIMLFFGLVLFATLLGNVTALVNASRKKNYEEMLAQHNLTEFLAINNVPFALALRIQRFTRFAVRGALHRRGPVESLRSRSSQISPTSKIRQTCFDKKCTSIQSSYHRKHVSSEGLTCPCQNRYRCQNMR